MAHDFSATARQLAPYNILGSPGQLVAIDGRCLSGKTSMGRFLAWHFNSSLIESDLFLKGNGEVDYRLGEIRRIINGRLKRGRSVFIEGITVLKTLQAIGRKPDVLVYVTRLNNPNYDSFDAVLTKYEQMFAPQAAANVVVEHAWTD
ncbi:hypothetical protein ACXU4B_03615 [Dyella soli]|uniref:AAA family ATPase n=1 Tax=Dyella soli TaxID=522319 RepID=A0A4R0YMY7_9GAMM|nr:hypothetical protein [Dyella soli]TCI10126.1 hypothetical protein EZM97_14500 [Dyella soli]